MAFYAFISDLHLGAGDALEDFYLHEGTSAAAAIPPVARQRGMARMHERFGAFLHWLAREAARRNEMPHLVILGDFLDLWQVRAAAPQSPGKIAAIAAAHAPALEHLRQFMRAGGALSYIVGNHDHEVFAPAVWDALRRELPGLNAAHDGAPVGWFAASEAGLYAEHGHQFDPVNAFDRFGDPAQTTPGAEIVRHIVNPCEARFPLLDNLPGARATLWYALRNLPALLGEGMRLQWREVVRLLRAPGGSEGLPLAEIVQHLAYLLLLHYAGASSRQLLLAVARILLENEELLRAAMRGARPAAGLLASLGAVGRHPVRVLLHASEREVRRAADGIVRGGEARPATLGPVPEPCRIVLCGHTHQAGVWAAGDGGWYVNTGSWRPVARPWRRGEFRIEQPLTVGLVARDRRGAWRPRLMRWADRRA